MYAHIVTTLLCLGALQNEPVYDPAVRAALWQLMGETRYGFAETEEALFIVREGGRLSFVRWPSVKLPHHARWEGAWPRGVVAIAHTHPNWLPQPSQLDVRTSLGRNVPVYVVTRTRIVKTRGGATQAVFEGDWRP
ncbi:MAG TPA: hypothetical protein VF432_16060 [Thermoanaerobaculia bacterium]